AILRRRVAGSAASVMALFRALGAPANSDYHPLVEQRTGRSRFTQESVPDLAELQAADMPLLEMFEGTYTPADHPVDAMHVAVPERSAADAWGFHDIMLKPTFVPPGPLPRSDSREHPARLL